MAKRRGVQHGVMGTPGCIGEGEARKGGGARRRKEDGFFSSLQATDTFCFGERSKPAWGRSAKDGKDLRFCVFPR